MTFRIYFILSTVGILTTFFVGQAIAQLKGPLDRSEEAIARGEELVLQFSQGPYRLPNRWAGVAVYSSQTTPDDPDFRMSTGYSYHAEDRKSKVRVSSFIHVPRQAQADGEGGLGAFPQEWNAWRKGDEYLVTESTVWKTYQESRKQRQCFVHPYCAYLITPLNIEKDVSETYLEQMFFAGRFSSLGIREEKEHTLSFWGFKKPTESVAGTFLLRFDHESNCPTEWIFSFYPKWDPIQFASMPSQITRRTSIKWKKFKTGIDDEVTGSNRTKGKSIDPEQWLPVEVVNNISSVEGRFEELHCKVFWKFGEEVPDSAFLDPRKHPLQLVPFEGADIAKIDRDAQFQ